MARKTVTLLSQTGSLELDKTGDAVPVIAITASQMEFTQLLSTVKIYLVV